MLCMPSISLDAEAVHHVVTDHLAAAAAAFLRRLEAPPRSREVRASPRGIFSTQQHRRMPVMAEQASVCPSTVVVSCGRSPDLPYRQRIHVSAKAHQPGRSVVLPWMTPTTHPVRPMPVTTRRSRSLAAAPPPRAPCGGSRTASRGARGVTAPRGDRLVHETRRSGWMVGMSI